MTPSSPFPWLAALGLTLGLTLVAPTLPSSGLPGHQLAQAAEAHAQLPVRLLDGRATTLGSYQGKVVVLAFWTVDCTACKAELPHLQRLYTQRQKEGLEVLAVNLDQPRLESEIKPTLRRHGWTFPVALDPEGRLAIPFNPARATPYTAVLDRTGQLRYSHMGYAAGDEKPLFQQVELLLKGAPAGASAGAK